MTDKLTRSLVVLEREAYETQNKLEQLRATRESFGQHLEVLEGIDQPVVTPRDEVEAGVPARAKVLELLEPLPLQIVPAGHDLADLHANLHRISLYSR